MENKTIHEKSLKCVERMIIYFYNSKTWRHKTLDSNKRVYHCQKTLKLEVQQIENETNKLISK